MLCFLITSATTLRDAISLKSFIIKSSAFNTKSSTDPYTIKSELEFESLPNSVPPSLRYISPPSASKAISPEASTIKFPSETDKVP